MPDIVEHDLIEAYKWNSKNKKIIHYLGSYFIRKGDKDGLTTEQCRNYLASLEKHNWQSLEDLLDEMHSVYRVTVNRDNWKLSECTCSWLQKNYKVNILDFIYFKTYSKCFYFYKSVRI